MASKLPELISVADLAKAASVCTKTVYRWLESGQVTKVPIGSRQIRVSVSSAMHLLRPKAEQLGAEEHPMPKKEAKLLAPLKYTHEQTGEIGGLRVPLDSTDPTEAIAHLQQAKARFEVLISNDTGSKSLDILLIRKKGIPSQIKYRPHPGADLIMKRIPASLIEQLVDNATTETFCLAWAAVHCDISSNTGAAAQKGGLTWNQVAEDWFKGELNKQYPEYVKAKRSSRDDRYRYEKYLAPIIGTRRVGTFLGKVVGAACDEIVAGMHRLSPEMSVASQRHVLQIFSRLLSLAVFPLQLLPKNDLPPQRLPKVKQKKAFSYLFPDEDAKLLACQKVPLHHRLFFGILAREGLRASELRDLEWKNIDLTRGLLHLDENKTESPRMWKLNDGVIDALKRWRSLQSLKAESSPYVIVDRKSGRRIAGGKAAKQLREAIVLAKLDRAALLESSTSRMAVRGHDLRATFVTLSLAAGKSEAWVTDRTGHTSSTMLYRYKRSARTHEEAELGTLRPLHRAIPELAHAQTTSTQNP